MTCKLLENAGRLASRPGSDRLTVICKKFVWKSLFFINDNLVRDDGFNVYVNGEFIGLCNMDQDALMPTTLDIPPGLSLLDTISVRMEGVIDNGAGSAFDWWLLYDDAVGISRTYHDSVTVIGRPLGGIIVEYGKERTFTINRDVYWPIP